MKEIKYPIPPNSKLLNAAYELKVEEYEYLQEPRKKRWKK